MIHQSRPFFGYCWTFTCSWHLWVLRLVWVTATSMNFGYLFTYSLKMFVFAFWVICIVNSCRWTDHALSYHSFTLCIISCCSLLVCSWIALSSSSIAAVTSFSAISSSNWLGSPFTWKKPLHADKYAYSEVKPKGENTDSFNTNKQFQQKVFKKIRVKGHACITLSSTVLLVFTTWKYQHAKKVVSDSLGLADFVIGLVNSVFNLPKGQVMYFEEFE